jgi:hypothetical protein
LPSEPIRHVPSDFTLNQLGEYGGGVLGQWMVDLMMESANAKYSDGAAKSPHAQFIRRHSFPWEQHQILFLFLSFPRTANPSKCQTPRKDAFNGRSGIAEISKWHQYSR